MSFSMAPLLMYSRRLPPEARDAIRAAYEAPARKRKAKLELAARVLREATGLGYRDVRELVGLHGGKDDA